MKLGKHQNAAKDWCWSLFFLFPRLINSSFTQYSCLLSTHRCILRVYSCGFIRENMKFQTLSSLLCSNCNFSLMKLQLHEANLSAFLCLSNNLLPPPPKKTWRYLYNFSVICFSFDTQYEKLLNKLQCDKLWKATYLMQEFNGLNSRGLSYTD